MNRLRIDSFFPACILSLALTIPAAAQLPNRVAAGDTTQTQTTLWARPNVAGNVTFEYSLDPAFGSIAGTQVVGVADPTIPAKTQIAGLTPGVQYYYRATDASGSSDVGTFRTPRALGTHAGFRMGVSGDWRGELSPYAAVRNAAGRNLDVFVALGDTIYADVPSPALPQPQAQTLADYRAKHNEVYSTRFGRNTLGDLRASTSWIAQIDDHEVTNDFAGGAHPSTDPRFAGQPGNFINETPLYQNGLQTFHEYNPIESRVYAGTGQPRLDGKPNLYRNQAFGSDAAVMNLDARSFRDQELPPANPLDPSSVTNFLVQSFNPARTMLGRPQVDQLKSDLQAAQNAGVTWKFVQIPEPMQNLGVVGASDRFEGYAAERAEILRYIDQNNIENVVFVAADIHGTLVNDLSYQNGPGQPQIASGAFEITTGSVAYDAPFGPTVAGLAFSLGLPGTLPPAIYDALPLAQKEAYIQALVNAQITPLGYNPLGLADSSINATLLAGGYTATNSFGWTEFDVDPVTQRLTVTTWGIDHYSEAELLADPSYWTNLQPSILSQFVVNPVPEPTTMVFLIAGAAAALRRRRP